jgi:cytochrome c-type biogenesis protein CcsB
MLTQYRDFVQAWRTRDAKKINEGISSLEASLSKLGPAGAYPSPKKRQAEVTYYRLELIWWSWLAYIFAFFVGIFAVATSYRWARGTMLVLLIAAVLLHCADLGLRWYVVGRIPNANMYEAIVFSTGCGALLGLLLEIFIGWRIFGLATAFLGFFSLALPELNVLGITNRIDTMAPILDNIMLRIHTVLIIGSYAVITLAFGVANCHLVVSAFRENSRLAQGTLGAEIGATICLAALKAGFIADPSALTFMATLTACCIAGAMVVIGATSLRFGWNQEPALSIAGATGSGLTSILTGSGAAGTLSYAPRLAERPRKILQEFDLAHRVLLYTAMVALFVGLVLGAVWADYSWGRPWGWDPKEVFALNTWLVYAILIHARFVTKNRGLWTSVLSVVGFAAMQFNWWVVNFYIVGLHSYA